MDKPFPTLFLSHGSPMLAVQDSAAGRFLDGLGGQLPRPRAIVVASAHFAAAPAHVGMAALPRTVHDFGGFPAHLYKLLYPAAGLPALAQDVVRRIEAAGIDVRPAPEHGLDHGVWVPLLRMYPEADIPVVPLSVDPRGDAAAHLALGRALSGLREDGVLVIGSGGFVHNLGDLDWPIRMQRSRRGPRSSPNGCVIACAPTTSMPFPRGKRAHRTRAARIRRSNT